MAKKSLNNRQEKNLVRIGAYLKQIRINEGILQSELSKLSGLNKNTITRAEKGEIKLSTFLELCESLDVDASEVLSILND